MERQRHPRTIAITDTYHTGNAQTCAFGYDDLSRLTTDQCGSAWQQTFGYDAFGNIEKTGSSTFLVGYTSGNHISGYSYDGDGNLTYGTHALQLRRRRPAYVNHRRADRGL